MASGSIGRTEQGSQVYQNKAQAERIAAGKLPDKPVLLYSKTDKGQITNERYSRYKDEYGDEQGEVEKEHKYVAGKLQQSVETEYSAHGQVESLKMSNFDAFGNLTSERRYLKYGDRIAENYTEGADSVYKEYTPNSSSIDVYIGMDQVKSIKTKLKDGTFSYLEDDFEDNHRSKRYYKTSNDKGTYEKNETYHSNAQVKTRDVLKETEAGSFLTQSVFNRTGILTKQISDTQDDRTKTRTVTDEEYNDDGSLKFSKHRTEKY